MEAKFEELIEGFITNKIGISTSFLSLPLAAALLQNIHKLNRDSRMERAGVGNGSVMEFLDTIKEFMSHLNKTCFTGVNSCEFHYAMYDEGAFYSRHKDQFRNDYNRKFSMIGYLNEDWLVSDGGQLIIHREDEEDQEILPNNQKAVFFQSDVLEHEVAIANRVRMSVTGWLKRS